MAERALAALVALVEAGARPRPAAKAIAELTGVPANRLYRALTEAAASRSA
jgi:16S rRNA (cytidine1402-2'-O)-methyltransferase